MHDGWWNSFLFQQEENIELLTRLQTYLFLVPSLVWHCTVFHGSSGSLLPSTEQLLCMPSPLTSWFGFLIHHFGRVFGTACFLLVLAYLFLFPRILGLATAELYPPLRPKGLGKERLLQHGGEGSIVEQATWRRVMMFCWERRELLLFSSLLISWCSHWPNPRGSPGS